MHLLNLLFQMAAILLLCRVLGRVMRWIGQPSVIAEILAGILLGPSFLGYVWPEGMAGLFPAETLGVLGMVAQLGILFFMFLVGLEFDPNLLRGQVRRSVAVSAAGMIVPLWMGIGLGFVLGGELAPPGVSPWPFALFLGVAMSVTAFPVLARILTEQRIIRTRVGALALASAAVGDVAAWCLLALVVGIVSSGGVGAALLTTVLVLAYSGFVLVVVRPVLARLGPRVGQSVSTDVVAQVFLLVVGSALATEWIGVHGLFGAFLMGAAMPRRGGLGRVMIEKMEDFVTLVLLPLFFAYSGLRTQLGLLDEPRDWFLCAVIIGVACLGKIGGTVVVGRMAGFSYREAGVLGLLMNTRGLMELVVLNVGLDLGVISEGLFTMMVIMALFTTFVTSPLVARLYPPDRTLGVEAERSGQGVLLCVSDPATAPSLVVLARALRGVPTWALHLRATDRPRDYLREHRTEVEPLEAVQEAAVGAGLKVETMSVPSADPAGDILRVAAAKGNPLVLLGVHRSSFGRDTLGGVVGRVLRDAEGEVGVLVDHGIDQLRTVTVRGGAVAERMAARLGLPRVDAGGDLVIVEWSSSTGLPEEGDPSWLLVKGAG